MGDALSQIIDAVQRNLEILDGLAARIDDAEEREKRGQIKLVRCVTAAKFRKATGFYRSPKRPWTATYSMRVQ
jgi:hypothetical protein